MKLTKVEKVIQQLEAEKADAQKRCAADVAVLDLAIKKIRAAQSAAPRRAKKEATLASRVLQAAKPVPRTMPLREE